MIAQEFVLPIFELAKCSRCGICVAICPEQALGISNVKGFPVFVSPENCTYCSECEAQCPEQAVHCPLEISWE